MTTRAFRFRYAPGIPKRHAARTDRRRGRRSGARARRTPELEVTIEAFKPRRSEQQNSFLWGVVYPSILEGGGEALRGWSKEDLHEYFLIEMWGSEVIEGFGRKRHKPIKRSSKMTKTEFRDYITLIEVRCAEMGIHIPEPRYE